MVGVACEAARPAAAERRGRKVAVVDDLDVPRPRGLGGRVEVREHEGPGLVREMHVGAVARIVPLVVAVDREERNLRRKVPVEQRLHVPDLVRVLGLREPPAVRDRGRREIAAVDDGVEPGRLRHGSEKPDRRLRLRQHAGRAVPVVRHRIRRGIVARNAPALVDVGEEPERDISARARRGIDGVRLLDLGENLGPQSAFENGDVLAKRHKARRHRHRKCQTSHRFLSAMLHRTTRTVPLAIHSTAPAVRNEASAIAAYSAAIQSADLAARR